MVLDLLLQKCLNRSSNKRQATSRKQRDLEVAVSAAVIPSSIKPPRKRRLSNDDDDSVGLQVKASRREDASRASGGPFGGVSDGASVLERIIDESPHTTTPTPEPCASQSSAALASIPASPMEADGSVADIMEPAMVSPIPASFFSPVGSEDEVQQPVPCSPDTLPHRRTSADENSGHDRACVDLTIFDCLHVCVPIDVDDGVEDFYQHMQKRLESIWGKVQDFVVLLRPDRSTGPEWYWIEEGDTLTWLKLKEEAGRRSVGGVHFTGRLIKVTELAK